MPIEFTAIGSAQAVSRAIEAYARGQGHVSALVVPWESEATRLVMAVTAVKADGWAIEHTNLGTITLAESGGDQTIVTFTSTSSLPPHTESGKLAALFDSFAEQVRSKLRIAS